MNYDTDAICAAKILQTIFRYDAIAYTLIPVSTISELRDAYKEHAHDVSYFILMFYFIRVGRLVFGIVGLRFQFLSMCLTESLRMCSCISHLMLSFTLQLDRLY